MPDLLERAQRAAERPTAALLHAERCLAQRGLPEPCTVCGDACPAEAVSFERLDAAGTHEALGMPEPTRPRIDAEACTSCGRCIAACPTGALGATGALADDALLDAVQRAVRAARAAAEAQGRAASDGDAGEAADPAAAETGEPDASQVVFACERETAGAGGGAGLAGGASIALPCLGWIDEALLVHAVAAGAQIVSLPVCACAGCPQQHAVRDLPRTAQQAQRIIDLWELGGTVELVDEQPDAGTGARGDAGGGLSRRGLFSRARTTLVDAATSAATLQMEAIIGTPGDGSVAEPDRRRWQLLDDLHVAGLPADSAVVSRALAPRVDVDIERCSGCAHCALFCPTGALRKAGKGPGGTTVLEFDAARCLDCGACAEVCRYGALSCDESLTVGELFALDPHEIVIPKRRVLPERRRA